MKKLILISLLALSSYIGIEAQVTSQKSYQIVENGITISHVEIANNKGTLFISMDMDARQLHLKSDHELVLTPVMMSAAQDEYLELPAITIAGRNRWYRYLRNTKDEDFLRDLYRHEKDIEMIHYQTSIPYQSWMDLSELFIRDSRCGCMKKIFSENENTIAQIDFLPKKIIPIRFIPEFLYVKPTITEKVSEVSGSTYISFPVNHTDIIEDYGNNPEELKKIYTTIDQLKNDQYVQKIKSLTFKGYASPDGSYTTNARLAKERTQSLVKHVSNLYDFPTEIIQQSYEAEDWKGLEEYVQHSSLSHKEEILTLISNTDLTPDQREWKIKTTYPSDYHQLVKECYPSLRHSDYTICFSMKEILDVNEAKRLLNVRPAVLSPNEFYMIANSYEEGSEKYNEAFDIMVRIYPNDITANLNAANVSMSRGDLVSAQKFLEKSGESATALYTRGIFHALKKDYKVARTYLNEALVRGIKASDAALEQIERIELQQLEIEKQNLNQ